MRERITYGTTVTVRRVLGELNLLFRILKDEEGRGIHNLSANTDVSLADKNSGVVDGGGKTALVNDGLETAVHELLGSQTEDIIKLLLLFTKKTGTGDTADESGTLEQTARIVLRKSQKLSSSLDRRNKKRDVGTGGRRKRYLTHLGKSELNSPDFTLAAETVLTADVKFLINTLGFIGTTGGSGGLTI